MKAGWAAVALVLPGVPAQARFAPPLDTELRLVSTEVREEGGATRSFTAERRLVFREDDRGFRAELTLVAARADAEPRVASAFEAGLKSLRGRPVRIVLDAGGAILGVEEEQALLAAVAEAMAGASPTTRQLADALRTLPPSERQALLAGDLAPVLAAGDAGLAAGGGAVEVAARSPVGAPIVLHGRRTITLEARSVRIVTHADAALPGDGGRLTIDRTRRVDAATGLLIEQSETVRTGAAGTDQQLTRTLTLSR